MHSDKYVVFKVGSEEFGISVSSVVSIEKMVDITQLPQVSEYLMGIANFRDIIVPIFDISQILYSQKLKQKDGNKIILVQLEDYIVGLIVDEAKEILNVHSRNLKEIKMIVNQNSFIEGVVSLDRGLVTIINLPELIKSMEDIEEVQKQMSLIAG